MPIYRVGVRETWYRYGDLYVRAMSQIGARCGADGAVDSSDWENEFAKAEVQEIAPATDFDRRYDDLYDESGDLVEEQA